MVPLSSLILAQRIFEQAEKLIVPRNRCKWSGIFFIESQLFLSMEIAGYIFEG